MTRLKHLGMVGSFLLAFIAVTIVSLVLLIGAILFTTPDIAGLSFPETAISSADHFDWEAIGRMGGWGELLDSSGRVQQVFGEATDEKEAYTPRDLTLFTSSSSEAYSRLAYQLPNDQTLVLVFPKDVVSALPTIQVGGRRGDSWRILGLSGLWLIIYLMLTFLLARRLQRKLAAQALQKQQIEQAERMEIYRGLAHDIKTPLAAMLAYTKAMQDGLVDETEYDEYLNTIMRQGQLLNSRVNGLLTITSLEHQLQLPKLVETDILKETRQVLADMSPILTDNGVTLLTDETLNDHYIVPSDAALWRRCIENIITNAYRHNPQGVSIHVSFNRETQTLSIADNGQGIPEDRMDMIRAPFVKGDTSRSNLELSGLGLYISEQILDFLGWELLLSNQTTGGLRVEFQSRVRES